MNAVVTHQESTALAVIPSAGYDYLPATFDEAWTFSQMLANSDLVPKDFKGKPENCFLAMAWGREIGLRPLSAIQNIAVINGRPSLWGDVMLAIVRASPLCEYVQEGWNDDGTAWCKAKRRGEPEQVRLFSIDDSKTAGLFGKQGPWQTGPKRMRQMRARAWALRDVFTDLLKGLHMAEEAMDMPPPAERHMGPADVVQPGTPAGPSAGTAHEIVTYPQADFDRNFPSWEAAIKKGGDPEAVIKKVQTKAPLTDEQKAKIRAAKPAAPAQDQQPTDAAPRFTYAQVAERINKAGDADALAIARDLIPAVTDPEQRKELQTLADTREGELA